MAASTNLLEELASDYETAESLLAAKDPDTEPYKSKYAGRDLMKQMLAKVSSHQEVGECWSECVRAGLYAAIGIVDMDVQELAEAEADLTKAIEAADSIVMTSKQQLDKIVFVKIKTYNQVRSTFISFLLFTK